MESMLRAPVRGYARALLGTVALALAVALVLGAATAQAQTSNVCRGDPPATGEGINCTENDTSVDNIKIDTSDVPIITTADAIPGINAEHAGNADIDIKASDINTMGVGSHGVSAKHTGTGNLMVTFKGGGNVEIGKGGYGIYGRHEGMGNVTLMVEGVSGANTTIKTSPPPSGNNTLFSYAIAGDNGGLGGVDLTVSDVTIMAEGFSTGENARGVSGRIWPSHVPPPNDGDSLPSGDYDVEIDVTRSQISTMGRTAYGIYGEHTGTTTTAVLNGNVDITATNTDITTTGLYAAGIYGKNASAVGDIILNMRGGSITTEEREGYGIYLFKADFAKTGKSGAITATVTDAELRTKGVESHGIYGRHQGTGAVNINVGNSSITTESTDAANSYGETLAHGIFGRHLGTGGNININVQGGSIETRGVFSYGIRGDMGEGNGDELSIVTGGGNTITTTGSNGHGIVAYHYGTEHDTSKITIDVGGTIDASGVGAQGVRVGTLTSGAPARVAAIGAIDEYGEFVEPGEGGGYGEDDEYGYRRQTVTVNGSVTSAAEGVYLAGGGKVVIGPRGSINSASGIAILAIGDTPVDGGDPIKPKLRVDMNLGGYQKVAQALGENWILNDGGETTIAVNGTVLHDGDTDDGAKGVTGRTAPNGAWNVRMREEGVAVDRTQANWRMSEPTAGVVVVADRDFSAADFNESRRPQPPPPPPPPPMRQTVMVDEHVFGGSDDQAGVLLEGDGEVYIGPEGSVGAESGIAILATGDFPKLLVNLNLDGRRVANVIGDDWIINDGGETTIVVNDVTLHDGATGVVRDAMAPKGAFNVTMRPEGVTVRDRSDPDPANWVITEPAAGVVVDRDFSAEDFVETSTQPMFTEEYAPRAALYELLPDFLLRLMGPGPNRRCGSTPDSSVWTRVAGGQGTYESVHSTTGATYEFDRFETEGGLSASLTKRVKGWVSVRRVQGTAGAASPTGGGEIDVRGLGSSVGGSWQGANDVYAVGCFSYMAYNVDFASTQQGLLKAGTDGRAYTLDFEAGRRLAMGETLHLTPRAWVVGSRVSVDTFTDAVDARVSLADADRVLVGLGVQADTTRPWAGGAFFLRGSMDFEQIVSGAKTTTQVSGEPLSAEATDNSLLVGLKGVYRHDRVTVGAELAARQELGSTDSEYTGFLNVGLRF